MGSPITHREDQPRLTDIPSPSGLIVVGAIAVAALAVAAIGLTHAQDNERWVSYQLWGGVTLALVTGVQLALAVARRRAALLAAERELLRLEDCADRALDRSDVGGYDLRNLAGRARELASLLAEAGAGQLALRADRLALRLPVSAGPDG